MCYVEYQETSHDYLTFLMVKVTALSIHTYARSWTFLLVGQGITKLMADPSLLTVLKRYPDPYAEFLPADVASKLTLKLAIQ